MKKLLLLFLFICSSLHAQVFLDTLASYYVGPGVLYTEIKAPTVPWDIDILRVDLKNPSLKLETVKAKDKYLGLEDLSSMAARKSYPGHYVVGAINADYFDMGTGEMINIQIAEGKVLRGPTKHSVIGFDWSNKPMMALVTMDSKVFANGTQLKINEVNQGRGTDQLILYNDFMNTTKTNTSGTEALIRPVNGWVVNDTMKCVVESIVASVGNMAVPAGKAVLSGHGAAATFISNNLHAGDTIKIYQGINPGLKRLKEMVGGVPRIVNNGQNYVETALKYESGSSTYTREPRTAAGISKDSSYLYLVTLDGRNASVGATLAELADLLVRIGVYHGINLDGGGSTTILVRDSLMNYPSGGGIERSDGNGFLVVSTAPNQFSSEKNISLNIHNRRVYKGDKVKLNVFALDEYNNPKLIDPSAIQYTLSSSTLGSVDSKGVFTAGNSSVKGYIRVKYNNFTDSTYIYVKSVSKVTLTPKVNLIDNIKPFSLTISAADMDDMPRSIAYADVIWKSTNTSVAIVDSLGIIKGISEGQVKIIASIPGVTADTVSLSVQIGKGYSVLDQMENLSNWKVTGLNIDTAKTKLSVVTDNKTQGTGALKLDYRFTYNPTVASMVYLNTNIPVYGIPDSLFIDSRTDTAKHKLSFIFSDNDEELFRVNAFGYIDTPDKFKSIPTPLKTFAPVGSGTFYYPAVLTKLEIQLRYQSSMVSGQTYTGTIYLDNLRVKYPATTDVNDKPNSAVVEGYALLQNYPNPFNPSTVIEFSTMNDENVSLKVYDILGREVAVLAQGMMKKGMHKVVWNAGSNPSGIYIYRLQSGNYSETKKMSLVR